MRTNSTEKKIPTNPDRQLSRGIRINPPIIPMIERNSNSHRRGVRRTEYHNITTQNPKTIPPNPHPMYPNNVSNIAAMALCTRERCIFITVPVAPSSGLPFRLKGFRNQQDGSQQDAADASRTQSPHPSVTVSSKDNIDQPYNRRQKENTSMKPE